MISPIETTSEPGGIPIKYFLTPDLMPEGEVVAQLRTLASATGLVHHVAVLPDIHLKSRNPSPTGTAVAARDTLVPRAVDTGICCGMRMIGSTIPVRELTSSVLDELFAEIMRTVPVLFHEQEVLSRSDMAAILTTGGQWSRDRFGLSDEELDRIEDRGTMPTDTDDHDAIVRSVPRKALEKGLRCFGTLGDGNHFLELQEIVEVLDAEVARHLGLAAGMAVFMLHTGSRSVGSKTMKTYLAEFEEKRRNAAAAVPPGTIWSLPADSEDGVRFARGVAAASNFGFANRIAITAQLRTAVAMVLGDKSLQLPLLYDCAHVSIKPEQWNGERLWIHRHGASRALPAAQMAGHPVFAHTGQPVPIPGSMGHDSFIGVTADRAEASFYSVNHGAGRVMDKPEAVKRFTTQQVESEMRAKNIRLYRYGSDNIAEQAPSSFKDIGGVIHAMSSLALARPVVRLRPVAVLKG